jgi:hypothetical protein
LIEDFIIVIALVVFAISLFAGMLVFFAENDVGTDESTIGNNATSLDITVQSSLGLSQLFGIAEPPKVLHTEPGHFEKLGREGYDCSTLASIHIRVQCLDGRTAMLEERIAGLEAGQ